MNMLDTQKTKEYLRCAFKLETELYKNKKLLERYEKSRYSKMPEEPKKHTYTEPKKPTIMARTNQTTTSAKPLGQIGIILLSIAGLSFVIGLFSAIVDGAAAPLAGIILASPFAGLGIFFCKKEARKADQEFSEIDKKNQEAYIKNLEIYRNNVKTRKNIMKLKLRNII